jgi:hypothetical protein
MRDLCAIEPRWPEETIVRKGEIGVGEGGGKIGLAAIAAAWLEIEGR